MLKCDFNKAALQLYRNRTSAWVSAINLLHIFKTHFPKNNSGGLLLTTTKSSFSTVPLFLDSLQNMSKIHVKLEKIQTLTL